MPKSGSQKRKEKSFKEQARIQTGQGTSQSQVQQSIQVSRNLAETPQIMEISSSASEPVRDQDQTDNNPVSVKPAPIVIQDSTMQSQSNMSEFLKASAAG